MRSFLLAVPLLAASCGQAVERVSEAPRSAAACAAVAALWPELEAASLVQARWEHAANYAAASLDRERAPDLLRIARDEGATPLERVAAAELFRRIPHRDAELGAADLAWLRGTAFGGLPAAAIAGAARRVLAELGDWGDRLSLVRELGASPDPEVREVAAWCLQGAGTEQELLDLARLLRPEAEARAPGLAAATIEAIVRARAEHAPIGADLRDELAGQVLAALEGPRCPAELEAHAGSLLDALGALGSPGAAPK